jgi:hypothetical protein
MNKILKISAFIFIFMLAVTPLTALAAGGANSGSGDGLKGDKSPLTITSSTIADGEKDVPLDREIKFVFSKNIANITVVDNNKKCFSMTDSKNQPVAVEVIMYDDQLEREKRNDVVIKPSSLKDAEQYTITISPDLTSKSGESLGQEIKYTFFTSGFAAQQGASDPEPVNAGSQAGAGAEQTGGAGNNSATGWITGVIIVVIILAAIFFYMKRK